MHDAGYCTFHELPIPESTDYRVCVQFIAHQTYWDDHPRWDTEGVYHQYTPLQRFLEFEQPVEPGILYSYPFRGPNALEPLLELKHDVLDESHPRYRIEKSLLSEQPFEALWTTLKSFKAEGLPKALVQSLLADYAQQVSGVSHQHTALMRALAILRGRLEPPD